MPLPTHDRSEVRDRLDVPQHRERPLRVPLRRARKQERKTNWRILRAESAGDFKKAKHLRQRWMRSYSARLLAVAEANKRVKGAEQYRSRELVAVAEQTSVYAHPNETVTLHALPKRNGGWRAVTSFGVRRAAMQLMIRDLLRPVITLDPRQCGTGFSETTAVEQVLDALREGYRYFVGLDLKDFYNNINRRKLHELVNEITPLDRRVFGSVICPPPVEYTCIGRVALAGYDGRLREASASGLSQGSRLSPLLGELVVKDVLKDFDPDARISNFIDDFGVLARTSRQARAIEKALVRAFARPGWCLKLRRKSRMQHAGDGFDFLGYRFVARGSDVWCMPCKANQIKFHTRVLDIAHQVDRGCPGSINRLRRYIVSWARSFKHWEDGQKQGYFWPRLWAEKVVRQHYPPAEARVKRVLEWDYDIDWFRPCRFDRKSPNGLGRTKPRSDVAHWED